MVTMFIPLSNTNELLTYILNVFFLLVGIGISLPNCLSIALINFSKTAGTSKILLRMFSVTRIDVREIYFLE